VLVQGLSEEGKGILWEPGEGRTSKLRSALADVHLAVDNASMREFEDTVADPPLTGVQWVSESAPSY
jgi:hypothetical protein